MDALFRSRVLVLNRSWAAVGVAGVRRALTLVYLRTARAVDPENYSTYDFNGWIAAGRDGRNGRRVRAPGFEIPVPEVIVLSSFNRQPDKEIVFSRRSIFERDGNYCQYCGKTFERRRLTLDHVRPRRLGGKSTWENVVVACRRCNTRKGGRLPDEVGMRLIRKPFRPAWATRVGLAVGSSPPPAWRRFLSPGQVREKEENTTRNARTETPARPASRQNRVEAR